MIEDVQSTAFTKSTYIHLETLHIYKMHQPVQELETIFKHAECPQG